MPAASQERAPQHVGTPNFSLNLSRAPQVKMETEEQRAPARIA